MIKGAVTIVFALAAAALALVAAGRRGRRRGQDSTSAEQRRERPPDRLGAGPRHAEPVRRPERGGLHGLGPELGPADQLQPEDARPRPRHRRELGGLRRPQDRDPEAGTRHEVVGRQADHVEGREVVARRARRPRRPLRRLHVEHHQDRDSRSGDGRDPHEATGRADHRRPVRLRAARARLGQGLAQGPEGPVPAEAADRRQRALRRHRVRAPQDHHDGAEPELARRARRLRQGPVHQATATRTPSSGPSTSARSTSSARSSPRATPGSASRRTSRRGAAPPPPTRSSPSTCARSGSAPMRASTRPSRTAPSARRSPTRSIATS